MVALLRDVGDTITATNEPNFSFEAPIMDECHGKENDVKAANAGIGAQAQAEGTTPSMNKDEVTGLNLQVATQTAETRDQQRVSFEMEGNVSSHSPHSSMMHIGVRQPAFGRTSHHASCS